MANYHYREIGGIKSPNGEKIVKPEFARTTTRSTDELLQEMKHHCGMSPILMKAVLDALATSLPFLLAEGDSVNIEGVGVLSPTLRLSRVRQVDEVDEQGNSVHHNARHIEFGKVHFKPSRQLTEECRSRCHPQHDKFVGDQKPLDTPYTEEERKGLLQKYLAENRLIHVKEYCRLTQLLEGTARNELNRFCRRPLSMLIKTGAGTHKYYILRDVAPTDNTAPAASAPSSSASSSSSAAAAVASASSVSSVSSSAASVASASASASSASSSVSSSAFVDAVPDHE